MSRSIRTGFGFFFFCLTVWGVVTGVFLTFDAEALTQLNNWHVWLPVYLFRVQDVPVYFVIAGLLAAVGFLSRTGGAFVLTDRRAHAGIAVLAVAVFGVVLWGSRGVYLDYPLSMDEYFADYQARTYAAGVMTVPVPVEWADYRTALFGNFLTFMKNGTQWFGPYLPVHSLFRATFILLGAPEILNALAIAGLIPLMAWISRRIFPDDRWAPVAAALLIAGSAQIMVVGMTAYAHSMHLFLNMLWLALFIADRRLATAFLPWVGVLAMGLHQAHYHLMFAFPFVCYMVVKRRWAWLAYACFIYGVAFLIFTNWRRFVEMMITANGAVDILDWASVRVKSAVGVAGRSSLAYVMIAGLSSLSRLFAWQHLLALPLAILGLVYWKKFPVVIKLLALGCLLTLALRLLGTPNPGHGWGYRYMHNMLGNVSLLAVAGLVYLRNELAAVGRQRLARSLAWSSILSVLILLPIRLIQVNDFVRPFATASAYLAHLPQKVVIVDTASMWIGQDFVRNDPWLKNRPILVNRARLTPESERALRKDRGAIVVGYDDLAKFGIKPRPAS